jgi:hypothetical protein
MDGPDLVEGVVAKGVRETIEIAEDVSAGGGVSVDADRAEVFIDPTSDIENAHFPYY